MMFNPGQPLIAVDWGTSRMRAMLCQPEATAPQADTLIEGPGIARLDRSPAEELFARIGPWVQRYGTLDLLLGGMVGSNIGWRETPYLSCPLVPEDIGRSLKTFEEQGHRVAIVPGVSCVNALGQPDVMRGEEIQVIGWMSENIDLRQDDRMLCLPGTHTKWVRLSNGRITRFTTSLTGELFALLCQHSVLVPKNEVGAEVEFDVKAFQEGLDLANQHGDDLLHVFFSTRSRDLVNHNDCGDGSSYLSGLLIGADVRSALRANNIAGSDVAIVGEPELCRKFAMAIEQQGYTGRVTDGSDAAYAGFLAIAAGET